MSKTLKVAIIGCGGIANGKHLPSLKQQPEVELVAFCDIVEERAQKAAAEYGVEGAKVFTDSGNCWRKATLKWFTSARQTIRMRKLPSLRWNRAVT